MQPHVLRVTLDIRPPNLSAMASPNPTPQPLVTPAHSTGLPSSPRPRSRGLPGGLLIAVAIMVLVAAGTGLLAYTGFQAFKIQAVMAMQAHPVIRQQVGTIRSSENSPLDTLSDDTSRLFVFDVVGDRGKGRVSGIFETIDTEHERLIAGSLDMADGTRHDLSPQEKDGAGMPRAVDMSEAGSLEPDLVVGPACRAIGSHPAVPGIVGAMKVCSYNEERSRELAGERAYAFDIEGERVSARVEADFMMVDADQARMENATLILTDGKRVRLADARQ